MLTPRFVLTQARRPGYEVLLSGTEQTIQLYHYKTSNKDGAAH